MSKPGKSEVEFIGKPSGDCECFCWSIPGSGRLYPGDVMERLGVDPMDGKLYRFTITAEEVSRDDS